MDGGKAKRLALRSFLLSALYSTLLTCISCSSSRQALRQGAYQGGLPAGVSHAVASWYGSDFHGKPTSSGEIFDMYARTCAHREYPFGTRIIVTNAALNKTTECVVNDRGPFVAGRDVDLSYAAAKDIGIIGPGTAEVLIEVAGRDESYIRKARVRSSEKSGPYAIQVGSFTESSNAARLTAALAMRYSDVCTEIAMVGGTTFYRVRIGNFSDFGQALATAEALGEEGYETLLVKAGAGL